MKVLSERTVLKFSWGNDLRVGIGNVWKRQGSSQSKNDNGKDRERGGSVTETCSRHLCGDDIGQRAKTSSVEKTEEEREGGNRLLDRLIIGIGKAQSTDNHVNDENDDKGGQGEWTTSHPVNNEKTSDRTAERQETEPENKEVRVCGADLGEENRGIVRGESDT